MKKLLLTVAAVAFAAPGFAGSLDVALEPVVEMPVPAPAPSWEGFYVGGLAGMTNMSYVYDGVDDGTADFLTYGAFAGYNHVMSSGLMLGAEVAYSIGEFEREGETAAIVSSYGILDLKARAGFAADRALIYAFGGYSIVSEDLGGTPYDYAGWNVGAGVDFLVTDSIFVGGEYIYRDLVEGSDPLDEATASTISGRIGFKF